MTLIKPTQVLTLCTVTMGGLALWYWLTNSDDRLADQVEPSLISVEAHSIEAVPGARLRISAPPIHRDSIVKDAPTRLTKGVPVSVAEPSAVVTPTSSRADRPLRYASHPQSDPTRQTDAPADPLDDTQEITGCEACTEVLQHLTLLSGNVLARSDWLEIGAGQPSTPRNRALVEVYTYRLTLKTLAPELSHALQELEALTGTLYANAAIPALIHSPQFGQYFASWVDNQLADLDEVAGPFQATGP